eukprot:CAMPEP_0116977842 /NCGR_PEP_ID=MMETSP0467-20121206/57394_1 /TAXON_ID=283647 /ORGANISM="Mesodinium pulex, Strain SPMC105" /LENGTH=135 /DNA_ID=CAMNT_0004671033 /DNA_START=566 /DNA_END=973 /DNA_ORIENTATION=-
MGKLGQHKGKFDRIDETSKDMIISSDRNRNHTTERQRVMQEVYNRKHNKHIDLVHQNQNQNQNYDLDGHGRKKETIFENVQISRDKLKKISTINEQSEPGTKPISQQGRTGMTFTSSNCMNITDKEQLIERLKKE